MNRHLTYQKIHIVLAVALLVFASIISITSGKASADINVQSRYDELSDSSGGAVATHNIGFTMTSTTTPIGSILIEFCDNSPLPPPPACNFPAGMNISSAVLAFESGNTGYTVSSITSTGILLTNASAPIPNGSPNVFTFNNITNPTSPGEYYLRISTFSSTDGSGSFVQFGGVAWDINSPLTVTALVPPFLTFCGGVTVDNLNCGSAEGNEIDFGDFTDKFTSTATSQFVIATNASFGYSITVDGTTMTSGNFVIPNLITPTSSKTGSSQFGMNLVANTSPQFGGTVIGKGIGHPTTNYGQQNLFTYNDGDIVASDTGPTNFNEFTASYLVNVTGTQEAGVYTTTLNYIALANF